MKIKRWDEDDRTRRAYMRHVIWNHRMDIVKRKVSGGKLTPADEPDENRSQLLWLGMHEADECIKVAGMYYGLFTTR